MSKKKSDLIPRLITAIVALPLLISLIVYAPAWLFFAFIALVGAISIWEFCGITFSAEHPGGRLIAMLLGVGLMNVLYFAEPYFIPALAASTLAIFLYFLFAFKEQARVTHQIGSALTAILYGGVLITFIALLGRDGGDAGPMWILMTLAIVWASDTGAYFSGRAFGKHKLYPSVSPNKSVEGALGGVLASVIFALGFQALYNTLAPDAWNTLSFLQILALAIPANILGQTGDLAESLVKRAHNVKDSGTIIYGHGGILDRIDALFFASPWVYYFMKFTSGGF
ncbi:phosphatidate cytidylyltransferase [Lujinxingia vulgaris]|uniref:Phosphatidate cytidylyltransferase n=1 Tax=Lujinxingia vulgaris TaxID=2600176 RepID=A0A5C6X2P4_9DELT|nr:phosphatidate cytidylyltransferase [Lujinxingia vulgaris]TXD32182.1 phosphatidate cytidylyltransferase [Lujinxingia vulgaris]